MGEKGHQNCNYSLSMATIFSHTFINFFYYSAIHLPYAIVSGEKNIRT